MWGAVLVVALPLVALLAAWPSLLTRKGEPIRSWVWLPSYS